MFLGLISIKFLTITRYSMFKYTQKRYLLKVREKSRMPCPPKSASLGNIPAGWLPLKVRKITLDVILFYWLSACYCQTGCPTFVVTHFYNSSSATGCLIFVLSITSYCHVIVWHLKSQESEKYCNIMRFSLMIILLKTDDSLLQTEKIKVFW